MTHLSSYGEASDISVPAYQRGSKRWRRRRQSRRLTLKAAFQTG
jgi:hypothetical protein